MTLHSIHFAQYAYALPLTIRLIIRLLHISTMLILPIALSLVMGYAIHTQFSRIWFSVLQVPSASVYGCFSNDVWSAECQTLGGPRTRGTGSWLDDTNKISVPTGFHRAMVTTAPKRKNWAPPYEELDPATFFFFVSLWTPTNYSCQWCHDLQSAVSKRTLPSVPYLLLYLTSQFQIHSIDSF